MGSAGIGLLWRSPPKVHWCAKSWFGSMLQGNMVPGDSKKFPPRFVEGGWEFNDVACWRVEMWEFMYLCDRCGYKRSCVLPVTRHDCCPFCNNDGCYKLQKKDLVRQYLKCFLNPGYQGPNPFDYGGPPMWMGGGQELRQVTEYTIHFLCQNCGKGEAYGYTKETTDFELPPGMMPGKM